MNHYTFKGKPRQRFIGKKEVVLRYPSDLTYVCVEIIHEDASRQIVAKYPNREEALKKIVEILKNKNCCFDPDADEKYFESFFQQQL